MELTLNFAVFAVICITFCHSRTFEHRRTSVLPKKSVNISYPADYIDKLVSMLSPEEQKELFYENNIDVDDRVGDLGHEFCSSYETVTYPTILDATDYKRTKYYVVNTAKYAQYKIVWICDSKFNHKCFHNATKYFDRGIHGCCVNKDREVNMAVLSVPVDLYEARSETQKIIETDRIVMMKLYLESECSCVAVDNKKTCNLRAPL